MAKTPGVLVVQCELTIRVGRPTYPVSTDALIEMKRIVNEDELLDLAQRIQVVCDEFEKEGD